MLLVVLIKSDVSVCKLKPFDCKVFFLVFFSVALLFFVTFSLVFRLKLD